MWVALALVLHPVRSDQYQYQSCYSLVNIYSSAKDKDSDHEYEMRTQKYLRTDL